MELFNNIQGEQLETKNEVEQTISSSHEIELAKKLDLVEEYSVDRFEEGYAILENRKSKEIKKVQKDSLPQNIKEGSILQYVNGKYLYNEERTKEEMNRINDKMNNLWN